MRILQINKFHFPKGGADVHYLRLSELLSKAGHEVSHFSMEHPSNFPSGDSEFFSPYVDFSGIRSFTNLCRIFARLWTNPEGKKRLERLLFIRRPQISHLHGIYHQLTASILPVLKRNNIPMVMTVHDHYLLTPKYNVLRTEASFIKRTLAWLSWQWEQTRNVYRKHITKFILPSQYMYDRFLSAGWPKESLALLPHFVEQQPIHFTLPDQTILFVGRLEEIKGVDVLLKAASVLSPDWKIKIAGQGPEEMKLRALAKELKIEDRVEWLGYVPEEALLDEYKKAYITVVPSLAPETFGLTVAESLSCGTPVMVNKIGALPELVREGENGYVVEITEDKEELVRRWQDALRIAVTHTNYRDELAKKTTKSVIHLDPEQYLEKLEALYVDVMSHV
ncbi:MAG: glycosyltransferase family 4 protein [bacterium]